MALALVGGPSGPMLSAQIAAIRAESIGPEGLPQKHPAPPQAHRFRGLAATPSAPRAGTVAALTLCRARAALSARRFALFPEQRAVRLALPEPPLR
ncbi:DUF6053 domain-containing protein [Lysobacter enzymogenes]|uniref:DUF6053 domain-containing protein n=1 Tax=Lysobacter enzymogenes TaxID=69 RepID=UPI003D2F8C0A